MDPDENMDFYNLWKYITLGTWIGSTSLGDSMLPPSPPKTKENTGQIWATVLGLRQNKKGEMQGPLKTVC